MVKLLLPTVAALALGLSTPLTAAPVDLDTSAGQVIQVFDGCGPLAHRGPYGRCRAGGQLGGYGFGRACPPGFHLGPYGRRCWPNH